ncbi:transporter, putative [Trypanosoma cruzi marinkellei]|uniref:Transporter, putative n=1 Tax=Trypanosoma cruzi marinkellei TaxID=85056 RepID=K2M9F4_TRYCR|nr:transporter, putative [Trypanosoma cruzi marinkellei]
MYVCACGGNEEGGGGGRRTPADGGCVMSVQPPFSPLFFFLICFCFCFIATFVFNFFRYHTEMDNCSREIRVLLLRLCSIWGFIIGSWAVLQVATPLVLKDIVGKDVAPTWQGLFSATTAVSGMIFCALTGHFSDRIGRLEFLTPWVIFFFFTTILVVFSDVTGSIYMLWVARVAAISIPSTIIHAFLSDYLSGNALLEAFGYVGATFGTSMLTSSLLCGLISRYYSRVAALTFGSFLAAVGAILTFALKPPSKLRLNSPTAFDTEGTNLFHSAGGVMNSLRIISSDALLRNLICAMALLRVGNVNTHMMLVLFVDFRLGWGLPQMSVLAGFSAFLTVLFQLIGVRFLISSDIVLPVLFVLLAVVPIVAMGYALVMTGAQMYLISILTSMMTISSTICNAKITAIASENGVAGLALGCVGTLQNILEVFASLFLGRLLSWSFENHPRTHVLSGLPFIVNGAFLALVVIIVLYSHKRHGAGRVSWIEGVHTG